MSLNKHDIAERFWKAKDQKDGFERRSGFLPRGVRDIVKKESGAVVYLLWQNPIAILKDGVLRLSDCGWKTPTTKDRLSRILGAGGINLTISQERGVWYLFDWNDSALKYHWDDGVEIPLDKPLSKLIPLSKAVIALNAKKLNEPVRRFMKEMKRRVDNGALSMDGGECWGIKMGMQECKDCEHFCTTNCGGGVSLLAKAIASRRSELTPALFMCKGGQPDIERIRENWDSIAMDLRYWLKKTMMQKKIDRKAGVGA